MEARQNYIHINDRGLRNVMNVISQYYKRKLTPAEARHLRDFIKNLPVETVRGLTTRESTAKIAKLYVENDVRTRNDAVKFQHNYDGDLHEFQKRELNGMSTDENPFKFGTFHNRRGESVVERESIGQKKGVLTRELDYTNKVLNDMLPPDPNKINSITAKGQIELINILTRFFNAETIDEVFKRFNGSNFSDIDLPRQRILLDSRNKKISEDDYRWDVHNISSIVQQGVVPLRDTLQQIVRVNIGSFWLPVPNSEINSQYYNRIRLLIKEFLPQSTFVGSYSGNNRFYHFEFDIVKKNSNKVLLQPIKSYWVPNKVIAQCDSLTFTFLSPNEEIAFDRDRDRCTISVANPAVVTTNNAHNLVTGDLVYIEEYTGADSSTNFAVNSISGHFISVLTATTFEIPVDTTASGGPVECNVYYAGKRLQVELDFVTLER